MDVAQILEDFSYKVFLPHHLIFPIPTFGISPVIHQQLVAMLRGHVRFVYKRDSAVVIMFLCRDLVGL